jgi:hypothetical protein
MHGLEDEEEGVRHIVRISHPILSLVSIADGT